MIFKRVYQHKNTRPNHTFLTLNGLKLTSLDEFVSLWELNPQLCLADVGQLDMWGKPYPFDKDGRFARFLLTLR